MFEFTNELLPMTYWWIQIGNFIYFWDAYHMINSGMRDVRHLYNPHGCEITDLSLIRDDDVIIAAMNKEKFRKPGKKEINAKEVSTNAFYTLFKEILKIAMKTLVQVLKENIASAAITAWLP